MSGWVHAEFNLNGNLQKEYQKLRLRSGQQLDHQITTQICGTLLSFPILYTHLPSDLCDETTGVTATWEANEKFCPRYSKKRAAPSSPDR
jgi:hypothetical protein